MIDIDVKALVAAGALLIAVSAWILFCILAIKKLSK